VPMITATSTTPTCRCDRFSASAVKPCRTSSKHEMDRNPTMPSAPSVSNLSCP
jgi:hypothetical protein